MVSENCWLFLCENNRTRTKYKRETFFSFIFFPPIFLSHMLQQLSLDEATDPWGVKVERVEMWVWCCAVRAFCFCYVHCSTRNSTNDARALINFTFPFLLSSFSILSAARMCHSHSSCNERWQLKLKLHGKEIRHSEIIVKSVNNLKSTSFLPSQQRSSSEGDCRRRWNEISTCTQRSSWHNVRKSRCLTASISPGILSFTLLIVQAVLQWINNVNNAYHEHNFLLLLPHLQTDAQQHCSWEEQHNHLSTSHRPDNATVESRRAKQEDVIDDKQRCVCKIGISYFTWNFKHEEETTANNLEK